MVTGFLNFQHALGRVPQRVRLLLAFWGLCLCLIAKLRVSIDTGKKIAVALALLGLLAHLQVRRVGVEKRRDVAVQLLGRGRARRRRRGEVLLYGYL